MQMFLHVGCGSNRKRHTTAAFSGEQWKELRLDINEAVEPDIIGSMTDMAAIPDESVDAVFSAHNIEHLYPHEVPLALREFLRVLKPDGYAVITCPDLQSAARMIAEDALTASAYESPAGPITPLDILYGHRQSMADGNLYMAHRCGFTESVLRGTLLNYGFGTVISCRHLIAEPVYNLWAIATRDIASEDRVRELVRAHFP